MAGRIAIIVICAAILILGAWRSYFWLGLDHLAKPEGLTVYVR